MIAVFRTISNWNMEMEKWAPHIVRIPYKGNKEARKKLEPQIRRGHFNVLLTTYDYVLKEKGLLGKVCLMIILLMVIYVYLDSLEIHDY